MLDAARKIAINSFLGGDFARLSNDDYFRILEETGLTVTWLSPRAIVGIGSRRRSRMPLLLSLRYAIGRSLGRNVSEIRGTHKFNLITFRDFQTLPFAIRRTVQFIHEIIAEQRSYRETALFEYLMQGKRFERRIDGRSVWIDSEEKFQRYYSECLLLCASIRENGVRAPTNATSYIGVAIDQHGQFVHVSKGVHRLAIAMELGIERVPVRVHRISARYFRKFVDRRRLLFREHVLDAIKKAVRQAEVQAMQQLPSPIEAFDPAESGGARSHVRLGEQSDRASWTTRLAPLSPPGAGKQKLL